MRFVIPFAMLLLAAPLAAKDSLGIFGDWGAFRDAQGPRCYAISAARASRAQDGSTPFASIGTWPARQLRGQIHIRPSRQLPADASARLTIGGVSFPLRGGAGDLWAIDPSGDAAILAAMRSAGSMSLHARDARGRAFTDRYSLDGAATAIDAASVGCARAR